MNYSWKKLDFDTEIFGFPVAKIQSILADKDIPNTIQALLQDLLQNKIVHATYRVNAKEVATIHALEQAGFLLVDGLIAMKKDLASHNFLGNKSEIRQATEQDIPQLRTISAASFTLNRFYNDSVIDKDKARELYSRWAKNSVGKTAADMTLVYEKENALQGFATIQKDGHIVLVAVDPGAQGNGIGKSLVDACVEQLSEWGVVEAKIETLITNIAALRAYTACGFKVTDSFLTLRWIDKNYFKTA